MSSELRKPRQADLRPHPRGSSFESTGMRPDDTWLRDGTSGLSVGMTMTPTPAVRTERIERMKDEEVLQSERPTPFRKTLRLINMEVKKNRVCKGK